MRKMVDRHQKLSVALNPFASLSFLTSTKMFFKKKKKKEGEYWEVSLNPPATNISELHMEFPSIYPTSPINQKKKRGLKKI